MPAITGGLGDEEGREWKAVDAMKYELDGGRVNTPMELWSLKNQLQR
jgi:hypothetical protein